MWVGKPGVARAAGEREPAGGKSRCSRGAAGALRRGALLTVVSAQQQLDAGEVPFDMYPLPGEEQAFIDDVQSYVKAMADFDLMHFKIELTSRSSSSASAATRMARCL
eukprot:COSAG04_NODE_19905_length_405_cov_1.215686_1_plen_107_part_10